MKPATQEQLSEPHPADALANERTYLAYLRTALAFIAFGFVIARFSLFEHEIAIVTHIKVGHAGLSTAFGALMALLGVVVGVAGGMRYASMDRALRQGKSIALAPTLALIGSLVVALIGILICLSLFTSR